MTPNEERTMTAIFFLIIGVVLGTWFGYMIALSVQPAEAKALTSETR